MKNIRSISSLLEQTTKGVSFKIMETQVSPKPFINIQWEYEYRWPKSEPTLGTSDEIVKFIAASTDRDPKLIMASIAKSPETTFGIARDSGNTANARLIGKDQLVAIGYVYIFGKGKIDVTKIPADKLVGTDGKLGGLVAFDANELPKYMATAAPVNTNNQTGTVTQPKKTITVLDIFGINSKYSEWFNSTIGTPYYRPILDKFGTDDKRRVSIENEGELVSIFWQMVSLMPPPYNLEAESKELNTFTRPLQAKLREIFEAAQQYDPGNFGKAVVAADILSKDTFESLVKAIVVIGLNTGKISQENVKAGTLPDVYTKLFTAALSQTGAVIPDDITEIGKADKLAHIISGAAVLGGFGKPATLAAVKALWDSVDPTTKKTMFPHTFDQIVAKLPFLVKPAPTKSAVAEFKSLQTGIGALSKTPNLIKSSTEYDDNTIKLFTKAFKNSAIPK
jgi:hypothetical protein